MSSGQRAPVVIGVVGDSGTGKTSLLERLIPALDSRGLSVGVAKHSSHGFEADRPGKDSHRLYTSGARAVALASAEQIATFTRRDESRGATLPEVLATLPAGLDLVLVEGFAWESIPRLIVVRGAASPAERHSQPGSVLRVVRGSASAPEAKPEFSSALLASLVDRLVGAVHQGGGGA